MNPALVIRTDYSNEAKWKFICSEIQKENPDGFKANVTFVSDPQKYQDIAPDDLIESMNASGEIPYFFVVDEVTLQNEDHPIVVVDLAENFGEAFRVVPSEIWAVENNLSMANMEFYEFLDAADEDGIFRGF